MNIDKYQACKKKCEYNLTIYSFLFLGSYMLLNAQKRKRGDKAQLYSEILQPTSISCLNFYLSMNTQNNDSGTLNLYMDSDISDDPASGSFTPLWSNTNTQSNTYLATSWQLVQVRFKLI